MKESVEGPAHRDAVLRKACADLACPSRAWQLLRAVPNRESAEALAWRRHGLVLAVAGSVLVAAVGCAGSDAPAVSAELASNIARAYDVNVVTPPASGAVATVRSPSGGAGASAGSGSGGANAGAAGSALGGGGASSGSAGNGGRLAGSGGGLAGGNSVPMAGSGGAGDRPRCDGFAVLAANCGTGGCHGAGSNLGTFAESEAEALRYVGRSGTVACAGNGLVIDPDDPGGSLMVLKLDESPPCGNAMPLSGTLLSAADIDCVEDWIGGL